MLKNQYLVVVDYSLRTERIFYCGEVELEAYKRLKELKFQNKRIIKADVKMCKIHGYDFIHSYELIEIIA